MNNINNKGPKERILESAALLFALKGYDSVGVREIARHAEVNISMISYYYNGKVNILKDIVQFYFDELEKSLKVIFDGNIQKKDKLKYWIRSIVEIIKSHPDICKVTILELPYSIPEVDDYKVKLLTNLLNMIRDYMHTKSLIIDNVELSMIGPAFISLVYSNFLMGSYAKSLYNVEHDNNYYDRYSEVIATLFVKGVTGLKNEIKKENGEIEPI